MSLIGEKPNPIQYFFETGRAPEISTGTDYPVTQPPTVRTLVLSGQREGIADLFVERILHPIKQKLRKRPIPVEAKEVVIVEPDLPDINWDQSGSDQSSDEATLVSKPKQPRMRRTRRGLVRKRKLSAPHRNSGSPIPILPRGGEYCSTTIVTQGRKCGKKSCGSSRPTSRPASLLRPLRPLLCVDGNETPVSLSESDTPTITKHAQQIRPTDVNPPVSESTTSLLVTNKQEHAGLTFDSLITADQNPLISPPRSPNPNITHHPTMRSPFKSPLKSLTNPFAKSPLKAASDRIIRKYGGRSPLKRLTSSGGSNSTRRTSSLRVSGRVTPKRLQLFNDKTGNNDAGNCDGRLADRAGVADSETALRTLINSPCTSPSGRSPMASPRANGGGVEGDADTPTALGKKKSRVQKETEVNLLLLGPLETAEEKETREQKETQELFSALQSLIAGDKALEEKYDEIMGAAAEQGVKHTYLQLHDLATGHPDTQELLLDLLADEDAAELGSEVYAAHSDRSRLKRFLLKLGIVYKQQPTYHLKVLKELESLSKDANLSAERLQNTACRLFRSNQHLLDEFLMLIPGLPPPQSMLPSPELLVLPDGFECWEGLEVETVPVPRSQRSESTNIKFSNGSLFVLDGKNYKPAQVTRVPMSSQ